MKKKPQYLFEQLVAHQQRNPISFHVPGHKMGKGFNPRGGEFFRDVLEIDQTEISGLDDLHQPEGVILESQKRAARVFGTKSSYFLVNGSTAGNLAMILSTCKPGDKIIVQRNAHKSVIHGLMLARAVPVYIQPEFIPSLGIWGSVTVESVKNALVEHSDAKAVLLMNPNYYGIGIDLTPIAQLVHRYQMPLLIDEAHGAHFGFHPSFPKSAIEMGADAVVQSTHKTLSAMTMGSMLHISRNSTINQERIEFFLAMVQSSSPSYPIMASLDLSCQLIESKGETLWDEVIDGIDWLKQHEGKLKGIRLFHSLPNYYLSDPLKLVIQNRYLHHSGFGLQTFLEHKKIYIELADLLNVLAVVTHGNTSEDIKAIYHSLVDYDQFHKDESINEGNTLMEMEYKLETIFKANTKSSIPLDSIIYGAKQSIPLQEAIDRIAAEMVIPYPPGIPVVQLGERITKQVVDYIYELKGKGAKFQGTKDPSITMIQVLD